MVNNNQITHIHINRHGEIILGEDDSKSPLATRAISKLVSKSQEEDWIAKEMNAVKNGENNLTKNQFNTQHNINSLVGDKFIEKILGRCQTLDDPDELEEESTKKASTTCGRPKLNNYMYEKIQR